MSFLRLSYKRLISILVPGFLSLSLRSLVLGDASCHGNSSMERPMWWGGHVSGQQPVRSWACQQVSSAVDPLPHLSLQMAAALADSSTAISWETPCQNHLAKSFPETEIINTCCFMLLRFGVICYSAIDKRIYYQKWGKRLDQGYHMIPKKLRKSMFICGSKEYLHHFETCHGR